VGGRASEDFGGPLGRLPRPLLWGSAVGGVVGAAALGLPGAVAGSLAAAAAWRAAAARRDRRTARRVEDAVAALLGSLASGVRAGLPPRAALAAALPAEAPEPFAADLARLGSACADGGPVDGPLRSAAEHEGAEVLAWLAAVWAVGERSGAPMGEAVARLAAAVRAARSRRSEAAAELAGPLASARLLAALPLMGLALGAGLGAEPWGFLVAPGWGRAILAAGVMLDLAGLAWVGRLARGAAR
jgi:tight adherence protein B